MLSRHFVRQALLAMLVVPALARGDALLRGTVESLRVAETAVVAATPLASPRLLADFYSARDYHWAWTRRDQVESLRKAAEDSAAEGLKPSDFHLELLRDLARPGALEELPARERIAAELRLSDALCRYLYQIRFGRLDPVAVNPDWNHRPPVPARTLIHGMESVASATDPAATLAALAPRPFFYQNLKQALRDYGEARQLNELPPIPAGRLLAQGSRDPRVPLLRERLRLHGDHAASPDPQDPQRFDGALRDSLMAFQRRVGLSADGVAGPSTLAALSRPYDAAKANKIRINLERMRWFYDDLPSDYLLVDVAGFMVEVVRDQEVTWRTRVVVGTPEQQTPSFRDEMEHLVFNPTWTVPPSIQEKMRGVSSRFKVVDRRTGRAVRASNIQDHRRYLLVQEAGPANALGQVKFMFPNGHAIYLHDTPSKGLFSHETRAYSHGCVRVQDPLKLAEVILGKPRWDQSEIGRVVRTNKTRYVNLDERLPVILYYLTAWAGADGELSFRNDIYGRDPALLQAIDGPASPLRIAFPKPGRTAPDGVAEPKPAVKPPTAAAPKAAANRPPQQTETPVSKGPSMAPPTTDRTIGTTLTLGADTARSATPQPADAPAANHPSGIESSRTAVTL